MFSSPILLVGLIFGLIVFQFAFIASKRSGKHYMAPLVTFLAAGILTMYGLFIIRGFEGMAYGLLGIGFLITAIIGTLILPLKLRNGSGKKEFSNRDKWSLFLLPLLFIVIVGSLTYFNKNYWIIEEGTLPSSGTGVQGYVTSTISEGRKMLYIRLGEDYEGKYIKVKKVNQLGATTVIVEIKEEGKPHELPYIKIGIDEIKDPLTVETTDGVVIVPK